CVTELALLVQSPDMAEKRMFQKQAWRLWSGLLPDPHQCVPVPYTHTHTHSHRRAHTHTHTTTRPRQGFSWVKMGLRCSKKKFARCAGSLCYHVTLLADIYI